MMHSEFGPSSLKRRELCPGSYRMEKDLPGFETEHSAEGTRLHEEIAQMIESFRDGKEINDTCDETRKAFEYFFNVFSDNTQEEMKILVEYRMNFSYCGIEQFFGTADVVIVLGNKIIIIDWKFGHRSVDEAADNIQGAAYALMAMKEFQKDRAEVHFFNPVIGQKTSYEFGSVLSLSSYIMGVINKAREENAPLEPSEDACQYCKAMYHGICPAIAKTAEITVAKAEEVIPLPALSVLSADDLCTMKDKCDLIAKLADRVDAELKRRCEENGSCGQWKIKESSGGREITDISGAFNVSGMDSASFLSCCTASVSKLEKLFAKSGKDAGTFKTEKEGKAEFNSLLADFIQNKPNKKALAKVS